MSRALQILLIVCYGVAWTLSSSKPFVGFVFLAAIGTLISLPTIFKNIFIGIIISVTLAALVAAIPCLAPLLGLWFIIRILAKIAEIIENFMLLVLSFALYGVLLFIPIAVKTSIVLSIIDVDSTKLASTIMFVMGALIMQMTCYVFEQFGRKGSKTAAFIVGLPGFLIMLVIFLFTLDGGGDTADSSDSSG